MEENKIDKNSLLNSRTSSISSLKIMKGEIVGTYEFLTSLNLEKIPENKLKSHKKKIGKYVYFFYIDDGSQKWRYYI